MHTTTNQDAIDARIHRFMSRKSSDKTFSKMITERLMATPKEAEREAAGIAYEPTHWHRRRIS